MIYYKNSSVKTIDGEIWIDIKGYKNQYQISSLGRVKSLNRIIVRKDGKKRIHKERILSQVFDGKGYLYISLWSKNYERRFSVARLVALNFITKKKNNKLTNSIYKQYLPKTIRRVFNKHQKNR